MIQLLPGAWCWSAFNAEKKFNFNGHVLRTEKGTVLVDPVPFAADDLAVLDAIGLRPDALVLTNRNHIRSRDAVLARWPGLPTVAHEAEAGEFGFAPDRLVKNGEDVHGLTALHLPGKSPGELGLYWPERRALLLGDALIAPNGKLKTVPAEKQDDPARLRKSLESLRGYDFDHLLVGDGDPLLGDAKSAVVAWLKTA
jgi:glyoxylase-like metal-dependent hydrolase (beta-lactamase superfamily II)